MPDNDGNLTFEEAFLQLERAVQRLESGGLTLDESLTLYEEGMHLARRCAELLDGAEAKVSQLTVLTENGRFDT